jgi:hypothetical protein
MRNFVLFLVSLVFSSLESGKLANAATTVSAEAVAVFRPDAASLADANRMLAIQDQMSQLNTELFTLRRTDGPQINVNNNIFKAMEARNNRLNAANAACSGGQAASSACAQAQAQHLEAERIVLARVARETEIQARLSALNAEMQQIMAQASPESRNFYSYVQNEISVAFKNDEIKKQDDYITTLRSQLASCGQGTGCQSIQLAIQNAEVLRTRLVGQRDAQIARGQQIIASHRADPTGSAGNGQVVRAGPNVGRDPTTGAPLTARTTNPVTGEAKVAIAADSLADRVAVLDRQIASLMAAAQAGDANAATQWPILMQQREDVQKAQNNLRNALIQPNP